MENIIYINNKTEQHVPEGYPNTTAYYSEELIRKVLGDTLKKFVLENVEVSDEKGKTIAKLTKDRITFSVNKTDQWVNGIMEQLKGGKK
ncbi:MAG: hypothetical protein IJK84_10815 [Bacteroidales bacterium]|nr:hypothetical protein [Bacteroidales bacterium]MBQ7512654.1 hypothetical protein [Prevotella sp.]